METYQLALKSRNHEIFSALDGDECIRIFNDHFERTRKQAYSKNDPYSLALQDNAPFDLVILDHRMPKRNGLEVAEQILSMSPSQRIVVASAYTHELNIPSNYEQYLELVQKPFSLDVLFSIVESIPDGETRKFGSWPSKNNSGFVSKSDGNANTGGIDPASFDLGHSLWLPYDFANPN